MFDRILSASLPWKNFMLCLQLLTLKFKRASGKEQICFNTLYGFTFFVTKRSVI